MKSMPEPDPARTFAREAREPSRSSAAEILDFLRTNKKWWLAPIVITLLLVSLLVIVGGAATPYLYTLF